MAQLMLGFMKGLGTLAKPWWSWIALLVLVNLVAPFFFLYTIEAKVVLAAFFVAANLQMIIFRSKGFVRLLGLGHIIPWIPLVLWLWSRVDSLGTGTPFAFWIWAVIVVNGISLVIDFVDVRRYLAGDRIPSLPSKAEPERNTATRVRGLPARSRALTFSARVNTLPW